MRILKKIVYILMIVFLLGVMGVSAYKIYEILTEYKQGEDIYKELEDGFKVKVTTAAETEENIVQESFEETSEYEIEEVTEEELEPLPDYSAYEYPEKLFLFTIPLDYVLTPQYALNFEQLLNLNKDVKGWISIEGTSIDYPIVQAADNEYYLRRTIDHTQNNAGSIFIECLIEKPFEQKNTIIYGHNQKNKKMFHELMYYQDEEYYKKNPLIDIYTPDGKHQIYEVYSAYLTESGSLTYQISFGNDTMFAQYIDYTKKQSLYETNVAVALSDTLITLSTCTNDEDTQRMIVHARLFTELTQ